MLRVFFTFLIMLVAPGVAHCASAEPTTGNVTMRPLSAAAPLPSIEFWIDEKGPFTAIIDTGNGTIGFAIARSLADTLRLSPVESAATNSPAGGVGNGARPDLAFVRAGQVQVAGKTRRDVIIGVTSAFDRLSTVVGASMQGNIGYGWLKDWRIVLDWPKRQMRLEASNTSLSSGAAMTIAPKKPLVVTDVWINGNGPYPAVFDTGAGLNLISPAIAAELKLDANQPVEIHGVAGVAQGRAATLDRLRIGGMDFDTVDVVETSAVEDISALAGTPVAAVFGRPLMERSVLTIDYPDQRISLAGTVRTNAPD